MPSYPRGMTMDDGERARQGMTIRRAVLGDEHVDRAVATTTSFTAVSAPPVLPAAPAPPVHERME